MNFGKVFFPLVVLCFLVIAFVTGCKKTEQASRGDRKAGKVIARVEGDPVFEDDVIRRIRAAHGEVDRSQLAPNQWQMMLEAATETEIIDKLLHKEAISMGFQVSDEEVDGAVRRTKEIFGEDRYNEVLRERQASEEEYRDFMKERLLISTYKEHLFTGISLEDDTLEAYYDGHKEVLKEPDSARLEALIFEDFEGSGEISEKVRAGEDMEKLARDYSSKERKLIFRRTNWIPYEAIPEDVRTLVQSGETGDIITPAQVDNRVQIYKILEKRSEYTPSFEEAKEDLREALLIREQQKILDNWYEGAKKTNKIEYIRN